MTGEGKPPVGAGEGAPPDEAVAGRPDPSTDAASEAVRPEDDSASTGDDAVAFPDGTDESGASTAGETGISTILQIYEAEEDLVNVNFEIQLSLSDGSSDKKTEATASESEEEDKENKEAEEAEEAKDAIEPEENAAGEDEENGEKKEEKESEEKAEKIDETLAPPPGPAPPPGRGRSFSLGRTRSLSVLRKRHDENRKKKRAGAASPKGKKPPKSPKAKKPADKAKKPAADEDKAPAEKPPLMPGKSMDTQKMSNAGKGGEEEDAFWDDASRSSKNSKVLLGDGELVPTEPRSRLGRSIKNMRTRSMSRKKARETRSSSKLPLHPKTRTPKKEPKRMRGRGKAARDKEGKRQPKQEEAEREEAKKEEEGKKQEGSPRRFDKPDGARGAFELLGASPSDEAPQEETAPKKARPRRRYIPLRFRSPLKGRRIAKSKPEAEAAEAALTAEAELDRALDEEFAKDPGWEKGAFEGAVWLHSVDDAPKAEGEAASRRDGSKRDGRRGKSTDRHADRGDYDLRTKSTNGDYSWWSSAASVDDSRADDSRAVTTWTDATSASATFDDTTAFLLREDAVAGFEVAKGLLGFRDGLGIAGLCRHPGDCRVLRI